MTEIEDLRERMDRAEAQAARLLLALELLSENVRIIISDWPLKRREPSTMKEGQIKAEDFVNKEGTEATPGFTSNAVWLRSPTDEKNWLQLYGCTGEYIYGSLCSFINSALEIARQQAGAKAQPAGELVEVQG